MENFNQEQTSNVIKFKAKSLISTTFPVALNQVMLAKSLLEAKSFNLLLQKNIEFEKLAEVTLQQKQMRDRARTYLDQRLPHVLALLTDITGFHNTFEAYYQDLADYINKLDNEDEDEKKSLAADIKDMLREITKVINEKKQQAEKLVAALQNDNEKNSALTQSINRTKELAKQLYVGDKTEITALEKHIKETLKNIELCNNQIANGALDSVKNFLKIASSFIANYVLDDKNDKKPEPNPDEKTKGSSSIAELVPIVENNLQLFADNKPVSSLYGEELHKYIAHYRSALEKLQHHNNEAAIFSVLKQQWFAFSKALDVLAKSIDYLAKGWQEVEQNFTTFKEKFSNKETFDAETIANMQEQWSLSQKDSATLFNKAVNFQRLAYLEVVKDQTVDTVSANFRARFMLPRIKNPQLKQRIMLKNSEEY